MLKLFPLDYESAGVFEALEKAAKPILQASEYSCLLKSVKHMLLQRAKLLAQVQSGKAVPSVDASAWDGRIENHCQHNSVGGEAIRPSEGRPSTAKLCTKLMGHYASAMDSPGLHTLGQPNEHWTIRLKPWWL